MTAWKIGNVEIENRIIAAPLAGISNPVYRQMMRDWGAGLTVSEMISDKALHYKSRKTYDMCRISEHEHPVSLQLFGHDPKTMAEASTYLCANTDCDIIDINMGCPVTKVIKSEAGSWLLSHPDDAYAVMKAVVDHADRPVTVKIRAGWDNEHISCVEIARLAEKAGISAIAVHGRTRSQFYTGRSNNQYIAMVKQAVHIPVIGNGDICTVEDAERMFQETGCDAVMIGRGFLGRPYFAAELVSHFENRPYQEPDFFEKIRLCLDYAERLCQAEGEKKGISMMRGMAGWYISGMPYCAQYRSKLCMVNSLEEMKAVLDEYEQRLQ